MTDHIKKLADARAKIKAKAEEIERLKAQVQVGHDVIRDFDAKIDEARAQVETLREALAHLRYRDHGHFPDACDGCAKIDAAAEPKG